MNSTRILGSRHVPVCVGLVQADLVLGGSEGDHVKQERARNHKAQDQTNKRPLS
jgi:hypothetical protein